MPYADIEKSRAQKRRWYAANRERADAYARKWREANPELAKETQRKAVAKWRANNLEFARESARKTAAKRAAAHPEHVKRINRSTQLRLRYGLTIAEFEAMVVAQNGRCAICGTGKPGGHGQWQVDHCHDTKTVRKLLCHFCNIGLGHFKHDINLLRRAIDYLKEHS